MEEKTEMTVGIVDERAIQTKQNLVYYQNRFMLGFSGENKKPDP